jgi:hypothetical protein
VLLGACGGDSHHDGDAPAGAEDCTLAGQKSWLGRYMDDWYFWSGLAPHPDPAGYDSVDAYFEALLYTGTDPQFPADRWSYFQSTEAQDRFYADGEALDYGVSVTGIEASADPGRPLAIRYVEPLSDAARQGVERGDEVVSVDGRPAADLVAADDYSALAPAAPGQTLTLLLRRGGVERTVLLTAGVYALTPVPIGRVVTTPGGRALGYVLVKDMISQALGPLQQAYAGLRAAGVTELVLDLRYNGGGLVSVATTVASYAAAGAAGQPFATLLYNAKQAAAHNATYAFQTLADSLAPARVHVLVGPRTCSAAEQVLNGLRGVGVDVVAIGDATCGKPVGFLPAESCGWTYDVVNFESVNARNEGRYFDGFAPTCAVAEDFGRALGDPAEPLLAAAASHADAGVCPVASAATAKAQAARAARARALLRSEPGTVRGMIDR